MTVRAQLSVTEQRRGARHPVDYPVIAEHNAHGDLKLHVSNISANGFMIDDATAILSRGDRIIIRLPVIGRIEAYMMWASDNRAGFQFERIIRIDDFDLMIDTLQPNPKLRAHR
ncbi:MAG: PilZ domain-containing protein [Parerythrobacter sp.]